MKYFLRGLSFRRFKREGVNRKLILCQGPDFSFSNDAVSASSLFALTGDCILRCLIGIVIKYCFSGQRVRHQESMQNIILEVLLLRYPGDPLIIFGLA
jgi:hypothetical protein